MIERAYKGGEGRRYIHVLATKNIVSIDRARGSFFCPPVESDMITAW